ncbi:MAG: acetate kinase [bacterium]
MKILVINTGSSSIKYQLFDMESTEVEARGVVERIGEEQSRLSHELGPGRGPGGSLVHEEHIADHEKGMSLIARVLTDPEKGAIRDRSEIEAVGHRVVHGGESFFAPALLDESVIEAIRENIPLAPLHNPANLTGIEVARHLFSGIPQVAVFDTDFHHTMPPYAYHYGIPYEYYKKHKLRKYGFHGTSHRFVARRAADWLGRPLSELELITVHLGNGSSVAALREGKSVDTSMGLTPLEGLVMGTRCGDLDPSIYFYLSEYCHMSVPEIDALMNKESGLKGFTGTNDVREIMARREKGDEMARLALQVFCYRIRKYVGAYYAVLGRVDAIVFTAGVGENNPSVREESLSGLERLGIEVDPQKNQGRGEGKPLSISTDNSEVELLVIPTNEELEIANQTMATVEHAQSR